MLALWMVAPPANATETTDELPARLVVPTDPLEYPDPICLGCKIITKRTSSASDATLDDGLLLVTYLDEVHPIFTGELILTIRRSGSNGSLEYQELVLSDVRLDHGQTTELLVEADAGSSWADVEMVWVELRSIP